MNKLKKSLASLREEVVFLVRSLLDNNENIQDIYDVLESMDPDGYDQEIAVAKYFGQPMLPAECGELFDGNGHENISLRERMYFGGLQECPPEFRDSKAYREYRDNYQRICLPVLAESVAENFLDAPIRSRIALKNYINRRRKNA